MLQYYNKLSSVSTVLRKCTERNGSVGQFLGTRVSHNSGVKPRNNFSCRICKKKGLKSLAFKSEPSYFMIHFRNDSSESKIVFLAPSQKPANSRDVG